MVGLRRHVQFLRAAGDVVATSFWFVPALMGLGGIALALAAPALDAMAGSGRWPFAFSGTRTDTLQLLGTILSSMITMTSLVFSITMVVLTLASSQFGPRLIRHFMARRQTQVVLGTYVLTIVYCLLRFAFVGQAEGETIAAPVSVPLAVGLTLASVMMLILHIHLLARSMMSETIIDLVGRELDQGIAELAAADGAPEEDPRAALPAGFEAEAVRCGVARQGYVQAIEFAELVAMAREAGVVVGFHFRAGDHLVAHGREIAVHPADRTTPDLCRRLAGAFTIGVHRTPVQDLEFSVRHLVEVALRALSPGVNDPYTAAAVIDRLSASLTRLVAARLPPGVFRDAEGATRVVCERPTHASLIGAAFDQIRQNGGDKPFILIHLAEAVGKIAVAVRTGEQAAALREQLRLIEEAAGRRIDSPDDAGAVARRLEAAAGVLGAAERRIGAQDGAAETRGA
jgi:uncharacterized membrane protein